jgi:hypothetical protein
MSAPINYTFEELVRRMELACEAAFEVAKPVGTAVSATILWESYSTCGVRVDFTDGRSGVAEVWWDGTEFAWAVDWTM